MLTETQLFFLGLISNCEYVHWHAFELDKFGNTQNSEFTSVFPYYSDNVTIRLENKKKIFVNCVSLHTVAIQKMLPISAGHLQVSCRTRAWLNIACVPAVPREFSRNLKNYPIKSLCQPVEGVWSLVLFAVLAQAICPNRITVMITKSARGHFNQKIWLGYHFDQREYQLIHTAWTLCASISTN